MSKGVSREMIRHVVMLIVVMLFLVLVVIFFKGMAEEALEILKKIFT